MCLNFICGKYDSLTIWDNSYTKISVPIFENVRSYPYLKSCSDHSLTCHNSRQDCNNQTGVERARWYRVKERVGIGTLVLADVCSLTDVLQVTQRSEERYEFQMGYSLLLAKDMGMRSTATRAGWH